MKQKAKKTRKIILVVVILMATMMLLPMILINLTPVQNYVVKFIARELSEKTGAKVAVSHVDITLLHSLSINDLIVEDTQGDTLIFTKKIECSILARKLFSKTIYIRSIHLDNINLNAKIDAEGNNNLSIIEKLFDKKQNKSSDDWLFVYEIENISLKNSAVSYIDQRNNGRLKKNIAFNPNNISITDINGSFCIDKITKNFIKGSIKRLSLKEKSGIAVQNIQATVLLSDSTLTAKNFKIELPKSSFAIEKISTNINRLRKKNFDNGNLPIHIVGIKTEIEPSDIEPLLGGIDCLDEIIYAELSANGTLDDLRISDLKFQYGSQMSVVCNFRAIGLPNISKTYIASSNVRLFSSTNAIQNIVSNLRREPFLLPKEIARLNSFSYNGVIEGYLNNLNIIGSLQTKIGSIETDINIKSNNQFKQLLLDGKIKTNGLNISQITDSDKGMERIVVDAYAKITMGNGIPTQSNVIANIQEITFNNYHYENIKLDGKILKNSFEGNASINDRNGKLIFHGLIDLNDSTKKQFSFDAKVKDFSPNRLNLTSKYPNLTLDFNIEANFTGDKIENIIGNIYADSIEITNNGSHRIKKLRINSINRNDSLITKIESDMLNGYIEGMYSLTSIPQKIVSIAERSLPLLKDNAKAKTKNTTKKSNFVFYFEIDNFNKLSSVLESKWKLNHESVISGFYNDEIELFNIDAYFPQITNGKTSFNTTKLNCYSADAHNMIMSANTTIPIANDSLKIDISAKMGGNKTDLSISWYNFNKSNNILGTIATSSQLYKSDFGKKILTTHILPTKIVAGENIMNVKRSKLSTDFEIFNIIDFEISGKNQHIKVNGIASKEEDDFIFIDIDKIDLNILSTLMPPTSEVSFGGIITGKAEISQALKKPIVDISVESDNLIFNNADMGTIKAQSHYNHNDNSIDFYGTIKTDSIDSNSHIMGSYFVFKDSLYIYGDAKNLPLQFLQRYTKNIFSELDGLGSGKVELEANLKQEKISVTTTAFIKNGHLKIGILGNDIYLSDTINMDKKSIVFKDIQITDKFGNKGLVDGYLHHSYFKDMKYNINVELENMLVFNRQPNREIPFYGQAFASGEGQISGNEQKTSIYCNAISEPKTKIFIPLNKSQLGASNNLVSFEHNDDIEDQPHSPKIKKNSNETNLTLDFNIEVNRNAQLQIMIDPQSGDMIKAEGDGSLRVSYNNATQDVQFFGSYTVLDGLYRFSFQQVLERNFTIYDGSTLLWNGDPTNPTINLKAAYQTKASIKELFEEAIEGSVTSNNIKVNCILQLLGDLLQPKISFDIELPNSDNNLRRALKNLINTDDMLNKQMIYLLAFGRFYTPPKYITNSDGLNTQTSTDVLALVASTVGSQLNSLLSNLSDKFSVGVNLKLAQDQLSGKRNNEYGININFSPNERVVINSSLGYKDRENINGGVVAPNTSPHSMWNNAILDFEMEYKLIQSGKLAAKVYNRTNNNQDFKDAPYTQGIGLVYRQNFNSFKSLFSKKKKKKRPKKKKEKTTTKKGKSDNDK